MNPNPSFTRYCRSIRFEFVHENAEISKKEYERMKQEIKNLIPTECENIIVNYEMLFTMINDKVCTTLLGVTSSYSFVIVKQEVTNDGNIARKFFSEIKTTAKITGLKESLIKRFVILQAISCGEIIDVKKFGQFVMEIAKMFVNDYG